MAETIQINAQFTQTIIRATKETVKMRKEVDSLTKSVLKLSEQINLLKKHDVVVQIGVKDNATSKLTKVMRNLQTLLSDANLVVKIKDQTKNGLNKIKGNVDSAGGSGKTLGGLKGLASKSLAGLVEPVLSGLKTVGQEALQGAMKREQQVMSIEKFMDVKNLGMKEADVKKQSQQYVGWLDKYAYSTSLDSEEIMAGGNQALNISGGNVSEAQKMMKIAGDMATLNPGKTFGGALDALAELKAGSGAGMEQFGLKLTVSDMSKAGGAKNLMQGKVASFFSGGTAKQGATTAGLWATLKGQAGAALTGAGTGMLEGIKPQLQGLVDFMNKNGGKIVQIATSIGQGIGNAIMFIGNLITQYAPTISGMLDSFFPKIQWIKTVVLDLKNMWLEAWPTISSILQTAWGIIQPIFDIISNAAMGLWAVFQLVWPGIQFAVETVWAILKPIFDAIGSKLGKISEAFSEVLDFLGIERPNTKKKQQKGKGKALGLPYVPYDNYAALLHRGEAVLPRRDADHYRNGGRASNIIISKLADTINASNPHDVDSLLDKLEVRLLQTAANMGCA